MNVLFGTQEHGGLKERSQGEHISKITPSKSRDSVVNFFLLIKVLNDNIQVMTSQVLFKLKCGS